MHNDAQEIPLLCITPDVVQTATRRVVAVIQNAVGDMEQHLATSGPFLCGDMFTLADITWMANFDRWDSLGYADALLDGQKYPQVAAYWSRLKNRNSYKDGVQKWQLPFVQAKLREIASTVP